MMIAFRDEQETRGWKRGDRTNRQTYIRWEGELVYVAFTSQNREDEMEREGFVKVNLGKRITGF
jgi:hypothetical protein